MITGLCAFYPYLRDALKRQTQPHQFTWLIWAITQGTATAALWVGGGGIGAIPLTISASLVTLIFFLSLREGGENITKSDIIVLAAALITICIWWFLDNPLLSVLMVSAIDVVGYIPTFRKSFAHPWTETVLSWVLFTVAYIFAILALETYSLLTLSYLISISVANTALIIFLLIRRKSIPNPI